MLDYESASAFVIMAGSIQEAQVLSQAHLKDLKDLGNPLPCYEGSFHYYPIQTYETDVEAERRIYMIMVRRLGLESVWVRKECYESFKRLGFMNAVYGTYSPNGILTDYCPKTSALVSPSIPLGSKIDSHTTSSGVSIAECEKEIQFSISLE